MITNQLLTISDGNGNDVCMSSSSQVYLDNVTRHKEGLNNANLNNINMAGIAMSFDAKLNLNAVSKVTELFSLHYFLYSNVPLESMSQ